MSEGRRSLDREEASVELLLKPEEAAKSLKLSERTLWKLTNQKLVPHVRIGKSVRYRPESLRAWVAEQEIAG
jgi:excisionase family DNA binding protein